MAFAVDDFEDLLRLLSERPEWRQRLRENVLGRDFEELPGIVRDLADAQGRTELRIEQLAEAQRRTEARVEELADAQRRTEARVEQLAEAQRRTEARVEELADAQRRTEARVEQLAKRLEELTAQVSDLNRALVRLSETVTIAVEAVTGRMDDMTREFGYMYEMYFERRAPGVFRDWLLRARPVYFDDIAELDAGQDAGIVSESDFAQVAALDIILFGRFRDTREPGYLAVEVSRTVNPEDVERASERAAILRRVGLAARAAVGGRRITDEAQKFADVNGVIVALVRAQPA